ARAHILEGLKIALDNIDEVIALIKNSPDNTTARDSLVAKFGLTELQANAILDMKLGRLTGLEREKIENELAELMKEIARLDEILKSETLLENLIRDELKEIKSKFDVPRITQIEDDYDDIDIEDLIPNENMVVTITHRGYIKRVPSKQYEKQKRGGKGKLAVTTYDDDFIESFFTANTHDTLMFVTDRGQLYWLKVYKIPEGSRTAKGKAVVNLINLQADEKIMAIIPTTDFDENKSLCFFTKNGIVKRTNLSEYQNIRSVGVKAINLDENDELVTAIIVQRDENEETGLLDDDSLNDENTNSDENLIESIKGKMLFAVTKKGMCIKFPLAKVREIGRVSRGVTAIKFKEKNDELVGAVVIENDEQEILSISAKGIGKRTNAGEYRLQSRGGKGVICMKLTDKTKELISVVIVDESMDLMALTSSGKMIRVDMQSIRKAGRNTSGVIVVNVENDEVVSIAKCPKEELEDEISDENLDLNL
ncbi:DNA gyrase C-terminal beta-propeller domain-containing protein, partial [Campylobacter coli]